MTSDVLEMSWFQDVDIIGQRWARKPVHLFCHKGMKGARGERNERSGTLLHIDAGIAALVP